MRFARYRPSDEPSADAWTQGGMVEPSTTAKRRKTEQSLQPVGSDIDTPVLSRPSQLPAHLRAPARTPLDEAAPMDTHEPQEQLPAPSAGDSHLRPVHTNASRPGPSHPPPPPPRPAPPGVTNVHRPALRLRDIRGLPPAVADRYVAAGVNTVYPWQRAAIDTAAAGRRQECEHPSRGNFHSSERFCQMLSFSIAHLSLSAFATAVVVGICRRARRSAPHIQLPDSIN